MKWQRRHVDWILSEADTEKELVAQVLLCKSIHWNQKGGKKQLDRESLQIQMQIRQGTVEKSMIGQGELQTTFEDFVLQGTSDSTDPGAYFLIQKYPQEELK